MGWIRFMVVRSVVFGLAGLGALAVLGLSIYQSTLFLGNKYDKPYLIFALVVSALTIIICGVLASKYSFYTHIGCIAFMAIIWLALASYTTDRIGYVQCESMDGLTHPAAHGKEYNAVAWCREMKALMAFSWFDWALFMIAIVSWIRLSEHEENTYGEGDEESRHEDRAMEENQYQNNRYIKRENLEAALANGGYANGGFVNGVPTGTLAATPLATGGLGARYVSTGGAYQQVAVPLQTGGPVVYQQPGHNVVISGGQVTQVPAGVPMTTTTGIPVATTGVGTRMY